MPHILAGLPEIIALVIVDETEILDLDLVGDKREGETMNLSSIEFYLSIVIVMALCFAAIAISLSIG